MLPAQGYTEHLGKEKSVLREIAYMRLRQVIPSPEEDLGVVVLTRNVDAQGDVGGGGERCNTRCERKRKGELLVHDTPSEGLALEGEVTEFSFFHLYVYRACFNASVLCHTAGVQTPLHPMACHGPTAQREAALDTRLTSARRLRELSAALVLKLHPHTLRFEGRHVVHPSGWLRLPTPVGSGGRVG